MTQRDIEHPPRHEAGRAHGGHHWMIIASCIPMLAIALILVVTGVAGVGFLVVAVMCTLMMALMMRGMSGGGGEAGHRM